MSADNHMTLLVSGRSRMSLLGINAGGLQLSMENDSLFKVRGGVLTDL